MIVDHAPPTVRSSKDAMRCPRLLRSALVTASVLAAAPALAADPAARGLDAFVVAPPTAIGGARVSVDLRVYGFPTVTSLRPLPRAEVIVGWDPDSIGEDRPEVRARTDRRGHASVELEVPAGPPAKLGLLVTLRHGPHERSLRTELSRIEDEALRLNVSEHRVRPGGSVVAWLRAEQAGSGGPLGEREVELALLEGGVASWRRRVRLDAAGTAAETVPIPEGGPLDWSWTLRASLVRDDRFGASESVQLRTRDETPGQPRLRASLEGGAPGAPATLTLQVEDATGDPVRGVPVRWWVGTAGAAPRDARTFLARARTATTGAGGLVRLTVATPAVVPPQGAELLLKAEASLDGVALSDTDRWALRRPSAVLELIPEGGALIPGRRQRLLLFARDADGAPLAGRFELRGDGLLTTATTDVEGRAELIWAVPEGVGARHPVGGCADSVAATVVIRPLDRARPIADRSRLTRCVRVERDAARLLVPDRPLVRGSSVDVRIDGGRGESYAVVARASRGGVATVTHLADGGRGGRIRLPAGALGPVQLSARTPDARGPTRTAHGVVLVLPELLPTLSASVTGGRLTPGGTARVRARLADQSGGALPGRIAAVLVDGRGGARVDGLLAIDTRRRLVSGLGLDANADVSRDRFLLGPPALDAWRRAALAELVERPEEAIPSPEQRVRRELDETFARVIRAVEGAVFEASSDPDRLEDARRLTPRGAILDPELFTLVTESMEEPPETPGGEPFRLEDLVELDPQVRYDVVGQRVTRLKLFRVLSAVRSFVLEARATPDEPMLQAPNALLRRMVREEQLESGALLDPWGGTLRFVPDDRPPVPLLSVIPRQRLVSPGPDGKLGTADDVDDPFERVLREDSPYARAMDEQRLVDARWELVVGDPTVEHWSELFERLTGTSLMETTGMGGLGSYATGSGGGGFSGASLGGRGAMRIATAGRLAWIPPQRTDADGRVTIEVPLPDQETTWTIALVGLPDGATPAATSLEVPIRLPLSVSARLGRGWHVGDRGRVPATLRNRGDAEVELELRARAGGGLRLGRETTLRGRVPAGGSTELALGLTAAAEGEGWLELELWSPEGRVDQLRVTTSVEPTATVEERWTASWVDDARRLDRPSLDAGAAPFGPAELFLGAGVEGPLMAAAEALEGAALGDLGAASASLEAAALIQLWAEAAIGADGALARRAASARARATGRLLALLERSPGDAHADAARRRLARFAPPLPGVRLPAPELCPPTGGPFALASVALSTEQAAPSGLALACWDALVLDLETRAARASLDELSALVLALSVVPHREAQARSWGVELRRRAAGRPDGPVGLDGRPAADVRRLAALWLSDAAGPEQPAGDATWRHLIGAQRPAGDFGDADATLAAVRAILAVAERTGPSAVRLTPRPGTTPSHPRLAVPTGAATVVRLPEGSEAIEVCPIGDSPVVARLRQRVRRPWATTTRPGPLSVYGEWTSAGASGRLSLSVHAGPAAAGRVRVRQPLPPGARLALGAPGLRQVDGVLYAELDVTAGVPRVLVVPLRFDLGGTFTTPPPVACSAQTPALCAEGPAATLEVSRP